jgi:hypothetical protein
MLSYLTPGERRAGDKYWFIDRMNKGKAIERRPARNPLIDELFEHRGGPNSPDFISRGSGLFYELTTNNLSTLARHLARSYVDPSRIAKYTMWFYGK